MDAHRVDSVLAGVTRVYLDTSVCIAFHSQGEAVHPAARHLIQRIADDEDPLSGYLSVVTAAELLVRPLRGVNAELEVMHRFLRRVPNLRIIDADFETALQAANIRALTRLALPDAFIIASAMLTGCEAIVTNDERWARRLAPLYSQFRWVYLGDE